MKNLRTTICECGKDMKDVQSDNRGYTPKMKGYDDNFYGGRVSIIKQVKCPDCETVYDVFYETKDSGNVAIDMEHSSIIEAFESVEDTKEIPTEEPVEEPAVTPEEITSEEPAVTPTEEPTEELKNDDTETKKTKPTTNTKKK